MWLTRILLRTFRGKKRTAPGNIYIGKYRKYRPVTEGMQQNMLKQILKEVEVMKFLTSAPHITEEEEKPILEEKELQRYKEVYQVRLRKFPEHKLLEDHLDRFNLRSRSRNNIKDLEKYS